MGCSEALAKSEGRGKGKKVMQRLECGLRSDMQVPQWATNSQEHTLHQHNSPVNTQYCTVVYNGQCPIVGVTQHTPLPSRGPKVGQNGYITPAFSGSPWWGEINPVRSGCGGKEQNVDENGWNWVRIQIYHIPNVKEASKDPFANNNNAHSITKYGVLGWLDVQIVALRAHCA